VIESERAIAVHKLYATKLNESDRTAALFTAQLQWFQLGRLILPDLEKRDKKILGPGQPAIPTRPPPDGIMPAWLNAAGIDYTGRPAWR
jgi:hypothetical protein